MKLRRLLVASVVIILIFAIVTTAMSIYLYRRPLPQTEGAVGVEGLHEPVTIYRDEWGVPHIYASSPHDLFFAQGYVHAQDRWWQMEINRHLGKGELSGILGNNETALISDQLIRTVGWPRIAQNQWESASPESKRTLQAYTAGINRYISERSQSDLAMQYTVIGLAGGGFEVMDWQPVDSLAWATVMNWHLDGNLSQELERAEIYATLDNSLADTYFPEAAWHDTIIQPEDLPFDISTYPVPDSPPPYPPETDYRQVSTRLIGDIDLQEPVFFGLQAGPGSTLWTVNGAHTESGLPLLANAPQSMISIPSHWYEIGLHCIEITPQCPYDVVGFSTPGLPLIIAGHNQNITWGIASAGIDTQDLYILKLNPDNPMEYEYNGRWEAIEILTETIQVNDDTPVEWPVYMTRWGPVINPLDENSDSVLAFQWQGLQGDWIRMLLHLNRATTWEAFQKALQDYGGTPIHFLYADRQNNIGYQLAGAVPIRAPHHSGQSPVPGWDDRYAWHGVIPFEYLPHVYNPQNGLLMTASQPPVPPEYGLWLQEALKDKFGNDATYIFTPYWTPTMQASRLEILLILLIPHNADTFATIQADTESGFAAQLVPYLLELDLSADETLQKYQTWMQDWNFQHTVDSPQAVLFAMWWVRLMEDIFYARLENAPDSTARHAFLHLLSDPQNPWWDDVQTEAIIETRDDRLKLAFEKAIEDAEQLFNVPRDEWRWDTLHTAHFVSLPVGNIGIVGVEEVVNRGPAGTGGSMDSINALPWSTAELNRYEVITLPGYRMIIDLSNFDNSRTIHSTGQSGHPASEHYADMIDLWRTVTYHDMLWDSNIIRQEENEVLRLQPDS